MTPASFLSLQRQRSGHDQPQKKIYATKLGRELEPMTLKQGARISRPRSLAYTLLHLPRPHLPAYNCPCRLFFPVAAHWPRHAETCPCMHVFLYVCMCLFVCVSVCLCVWVSVCSSLCLSLCQLARSLRFSKASLAAQGTKMEPQPEAVRARRWSHHCQLRRSSPG